MNGNRALLAQPETYERIVALSLVTGVIIAEIVRIDIELPTLQGYDREIKAAHKVFYRACCGVLESELNRFVASFRTVTERARCAELIKKLVDDWAALDLLQTPPRWQ